jgi:hypothetical protein
VIDDLFHDDPAPDAALRPSLRDLADTLCARMAPVEAEERATGALALARWPGVGVDGSPGEGRTSLLAAVARRLDARGVRVRRVDLRRLPHAPLAPLHARAAAAAPPGDLVVAAAVGAALALCEAPERVLAAARVPLTRLTDPRSYALAAPSMPEPALTLAEALAPLSTPGVLLLDGAGPEATARAADVVRAVLPCVHVLATLPRHEPARALPVRLALPPPDGADAAALARAWVDGGGVDWPSTWRDAVDDTLADPRFAHAATLKASLRALAVLRAAEGGAEAGDALVVRWRLALGRWPLLGQALRERDDWWWRDTRLAADQAMQRRPDALVDAVFAEPGLVAWLTAALPHPSQPAAGRAFAAQLSALRAAHARLERFGCA